MLKYASASPIRATAFPLNTSSVYSTASIASGREKRAPVAGASASLLHEPLLKPTAEKSGPIHQDRGKVPPFTVRCRLLHSSPHQSKQIRHLSPQQLARWPYPRLALYALPDRLSKANASMYWSPRKMRAWFATCVLTSRSIPTGYIQLVRAFSSFVNSISKNPI